MSVIQDQAHVQLTEFKASIDHRETNLDLIGEEIKEDKVEVTATKRAVESSGENLLNNQTMHAQRNTG